MPLAPAVWHTGIGVIIALSVLALMASFLTLTASALLLRRYRGAIARLMSAQADPAAYPLSARVWPDVRASTPARPIDVGGTGSFGHADRWEPPEALYRRTVVEPRRHAARYAVAGTLFAFVVAGASFFAFSQFQVNYLSGATRPAQCLFWFGCFAWPIVLTVNLTAGGSALSQWMTVAIYFALLGAVGWRVVYTAIEEVVVVGHVALPAWSGETPLRLLVRWAYFNLVPTLLLAAFRHRRVRAIAPLMLGFLTLVSAGMLGALGVGFVYRDISNAIIAAVAGTLGVPAWAALLGYFLLLATVAGLLFAVFGWWFLAWLRRGYQRKTASDQSLAIDALWLIFASCYAVMLAAAGPGWPLFALLAFAVYKVAFRVANRTTRPGLGARGPEPTLLVLRVFELRERSEALFELLTRRWRHIGSVGLIAGEDLATSTAAPHRFLAFLTGRLSGLFIGSEADIERSIEAADRRRDADGRFRINEFLCHEDTWQAVLRGLIKGTDVVVLMDLRRFKRGDEQRESGCAIEIRLLLATVPVERVVFVVDRTTDSAYVDELCRETCQSLPPGSPNIGLRPSRLRPCPLESLRPRELEHLLRRLCAASTAGG